MIISSSQTTTADGISRASEVTAQRKCPNRLPADPYREVRETPGRLDVTRVLGDDLEDAKTGPHRALGIVLVRRRHAEVGADSVTGVRLHHAAVLLDGTTHHRHAFADERLHLVRRKLLAERRRAHDVREEDADGAELVLSCLRVHDRKYPEPTLRMSRSCQTLGAMEWPLLADLPAEDVRELLAIARRRTFDKGEVVFHRDDPAESLHLIVRGRFAARVVTAVGDSVLLDVLGPGQAFGELALLLPGERRSATVSALEDGETRSVFRDDFTRLQVSHPGVKDALLRLLAEQVRRTSDRIVEAHYVDADTRVRRRLCELGEAYREGDDVPVVPLTQDDLAAMAGTSRATVNRVLREEEKRGAVALQRGRVTLLDAGDIQLRCRFGRS